MRNYLASLYDDFWDESNWFPPGVHWGTLSGSEYPQFSVLKLPIFYAFIVLAIRAAFEWSIARPLGIAFGIKNTRSELDNFGTRLTKKFPFNKFLSTSLPSNGEVVRNGIHCVSNGCVPNGVSLPNGAVHHSYSNSRHNSTMKMVHLVPNKSTLDKFSECCWRFTYYFGIFVYGLVVLWNKPWFSDTAHCWHGYPFQPVSSEIWWYYVIELSFYWSLIFSQFVDVQRKDFWVNFIHHIATVLLMSFSWADNFVRVGTLVLLVHDAVDFWLEAAKMCRYCKQNNMCNLLFAVFTAMWFLTRCFFFPFWILYSTLVEAPALIGFYRAYYVFNFLLLLLQILHIFWSIMILKIALSAFKNGEADDARSDSESDQEEDENDTENVVAKKKSN